MSKQFFHNHKEKVINLNFKLKEKRIRIGGSVFTFKPKTQIILTVIVVIICTVIGIVINEKSTKIPKILSTTESSIKASPVISVLPINTPNLSTDNIETIVLHISGAVKKPGLVYLKAGARIADAIDAAGGVTEISDMSNINLAAYVYDGMKIHIPCLGETPLIILAATPGYSDESNNTTNIKININTAGISELTRLDGIGESTAKKIIAYREEIGAFKDIKDILQVSGIGDAKFNNIKDQICV